MSLFTLQTHRFWVIFLASALLAGLGALLLMSKAMPLLKLELNFTRDEAVMAAAQFQQRQFPKVHTERSAAIFMVNRGLQNYVELEAGGIEVFKSIINNPDAMPSYWKVRNFSEAQEIELTSAFSANGHPLSFWLTIPDQEAGAALEESAARQLAERGALEFLGQRFAAYKPYETVVKRQTSGRIDYSFTYEHESLKLGEARFRIVAKVAGDTLVGLDTLTHIPEAFDQRFDAMRALNNQISKISSYLMAALLGLGGLIGGGIWLHRRQQLQWRRALMPAAFVAAGLAAALLSNLPMAWMSYKTTDSANNFLWQQYAAAGMALVGLTLVFATVYAVAEGLSRMAFPDHPRLFELRRTPVAATPEMLGRVLGAYGWAGFMLLYAMVFSVVSSKLGWWSPRDMDVDPNILASWRPALGPIFNALQAGTWEECAFRALPLALAAIIGAHFGLRRPLLILALVLQALIFGGAHADYPNLPGYSRLVELFIPALAFGLVYLRFGLVVGMITHFVYDLILMSLPIFMAEGSSLLIDKVLVVLAGIAPLLWLCFARYREGRFQALGAQWRNGTQVQLAETLNIAMEPALETNVTSLKPLSMRPRFWLPLVLVSLLVLIVAWRKPPDIIWPLYQIDRTEAQILAESELAEHGVTLSGEWHATLLTHSGWLMPMNFVWRETNAAIFQSLLGRYLDKPLWQVSWRKFDGPVELRTEQWDIYLEADGSLHELVHVLPEANAGAKLTREQARVKALEWIVAHNWATAAQLEEQSAEEIVRPARSDWVLTYSDKTAFNAKEGQAIIRISLSGDELTGALRSVQVPEQWTRADREKSAQKTPFKTLGAIALMVILALALSGFLRKHSGARIDLKAALPWVALCTSATLALSLLRLDKSLSDFQPAMDWTSQWWLLFGGTVLKAVAMAVSLVLAAQALHGQRPLAHAQPVSDLLQGALLASGLAGLYALASLLMPSKATPLIYSADWGSYVPWLATIFAGLNGFYGLIILMVLAIGAQRFAQTRLKFALLAGLVLLWSLATALGAEEPGLSAINQCVAVLSMALSVELVRRKQLGVLLAMSGVGLALQQASVAHALYAGAWLHGLLSAIGCGLATYVLLRHWHRHRLA